MTLTRRSTILLAGLTLLPTPMFAAVCEPIFPGLSLCDASGWRLADVSGTTASFTHDTGISATISMKTGLSDDELTWAGWQASHAPISARANVLEVGLSEIDGRFTSWSAYFPRHLSPPTVVVLASYQGSGTSINVSTRGPGETYADPHRQAHDSLIAAIRLDLPE
jgi:hypothetical protein